MLKKRIIGVVTVKNGWAVQSFGYHRYLPLGKPECLVENLDRWGADEILVQVIDRSFDRIGPDYDLLGKLARLGLGTPLIYGGGVRTVEDGIQVIQCGADRITVDALLHDDLAQVVNLSKKLGAQAIIASIPITKTSDGLRWLNYRLKNTKNISIDPLGELIEDGVVSEVLLTDWYHEGIENSFDNSLIDLFKYKKVPLIVFGGISRVGQMKELFSIQNVMAVAVGNFLNYREHAFQQFKELIASEALRQETYATEYSLLTDVRN